MLVAVAAWTGMLHPFELSQASYAQRNPWVLFHGLCVAGVEGPGTACGVQFV